MRNAKQKQERWGHILDNYLEYLQKFIFQYEDGKNNKDDERFVTGLATGYKAIAVLEYILNVNIGAYKENMTKMAALFPELEQYNINIDKTYVYKLLDGCSLRTMYA